MKKLMLVAMAALAITGCSQNEELDSMVNKSEINFTSAAVTRANHATTGNFTKFIAYAYSHTDNFAGTGTEVINGTLFTKSGNDWLAAGNAKFYWPLDKKLSFIAYSSTAENPTTGVTYTPGTTGYPTLKYSIQSSQEDLLVAQATNKNKEQDANGVSLNFKHALAQIGFSLQGEDARVTYKVTKITINGAKNSGTFTYSSDLETAPIGSWAVEAGVANYEIALADVSFSGGDAATQLNGSEQILMPQDQASLASVTIDVEYEATQNDEVLCRGIAGVKLPTTGKGSAWNAGIKTTYLLTLTPGTEVKLSGSLEDWTDESGK